MPIKIRLVVMANVAKGKFSLASSQVQFLIAFSMHKWQSPGFLPHDPQYRYHMSSCLYT